MRSCALPSSGRTMAHDRVGIDEQFSVANTLRSAARCSGCTCSERLTCTSRPSLFFNPLRWRTSRTDSPLRSGAAGHWLALASVGATRPARSISFTARDTSSGVGGFAGASSVEAPSNAATVAAVLTRPSSTTERSRAAAVLSSASTATPGLAADFAVVLSTASSMSAAASSWNTRWRTTRSADSSSRSGGGEALDALSAAASRGVCISSRKLATSPRRPARRSSPCHRLSAASVVRSSSALPLHARWIAPTSWGSSGSATSLRARVRICQAKVSCASRSVCSRVSGASRTVVSRASDPCGT
mmetsp:Transcript_28433/g.88132  ORF Transcript_28433/g.88132 Transcript_28433/m.88132 type:complete len:302 (-) Transcript_28433:99-1004(-)